MNYVTPAIPFFILAMALEFGFGQLRGRQTYRLNDTLNSLQMGIISRLMGLLRLGFSGLVFGYLMKVLGVNQLPTDSPWLWIIAFIAYDCCYYWKHRFGHQWRIMWASHVAHHQSEEFNLSTALRQTGTDYIGFVFYLPLYLAGVPAVVIVTVGSLNLIYQFWVHTEHIRRLGPIEWVMVTPSNHRVHHARNPGYIDKNYGGVFIIWDRLFGTFEDERVDEPCRYGITHALHSWNPVWANLHVWHETALISLQTRRWQDKIAVWFKGPAWRPEDMPFEDNPDWQQPKFDPPISRFTRLYTFMQYWVVTASGLAILLTQKNIPRPAVLMAFVLLLFSLYVHGTWLEHHTHRRTLETVRLVLVLIFAAAVSIIWPAAPVWLQPVLMSYVLFCMVLIYTVERLPSMAKLSPSHPIQLGNQSETEHAAV